MTTAEALTAIISIVSLIVAIVAMGKANSAAAAANKIAENNLGVAYATIELEMRKAISEQSARIGDLSLQHEPLASKKRNGTLTPDEEQRLQSLSLNLHASIQNYLNAYEDACSKYLDRKIDISRFKKSFAIEIRQIVERVSLREYFEPTTSVLSD